jgi:hypothetical protein
VVTPAELDLGLGQTGETIEGELLLSNEGNDTLEVTSVTSSDTDVVGRLSSIPLVIPAGEGALMDVVWTVNGDLNATINIESNDPEEPTIEVPITGTLAIPRLEIDPGDVTFAEIPPMCEEQTIVVLRSVGAADLEISDLLLSGENYFVDTELEFPLVLEPGASVGVDLRFAPEDEGDFEGLLTVLSNDPAGDQSATITGLSRITSTCDGLSSTELVFDVNYERADVSFILDNTNSMEPVLSAFESQLTNIAGALATTIPDLTIGFARHEDYRPDPSYSCKPFRMQQQQTSDIALAAAAIAAPFATITGAYEYEEAGMEALYQAATGDGYDLNCNGTYDGATDVPPFIPRPTDAFSGIAAGSSNPATPGTGEGGGMGFREGVLPIFISATDAKMKDPDDGDVTPGGCPRDASLYDTVTALNNRGGKFVGIEVISGGPTTPIHQMEAIAIITNSYGDMDGDFIDEPTVARWSTADSPASFGDTVVKAVEALAAAAVFDVVKLQVLSDPDNKVIDIEPEQYEVVTAGTPLPFVVTVAGRIVEKASANSSEVMLELVADDTIVLAQRTLYVDP